MSSTDTTGSAMCTRAEAARELGINPRTLDKGIDAGEIPAVRFGRTVRIPRSFIDELCAPAQPQPPPDDIDAWVEQILATAPRLSEEQRAKLAELLEPARRGSRARGAAR